MHQTAGMKEEHRAALFAAISDRTRLRLLSFLLDEEHCVTQCTQEIGLTQGAVSKHLARLSASGLVSRRPTGRHAYYRVVDPVAVRTLLAHADALIGSTKG